MQLECQEPVDTDVSTATAPATPRVAGRQRTLEELVYRYGQYYDSYLATEPGRETFWSRDGRGAVSLVRTGRFLHGAGGLFAPRRHRENLLAEVVAQAESRGDGLSFYNVAEADLPLFRRYGFQATKLGEEAVIELDDWTCQGKPFEWLRRQVNYCRRHELHVAEYTADNMPRRQWQSMVAEMRQMSDAFLEAKPQNSELRFLDGTFDPHQLGRRRLFAARSLNGNGRVEGFLLCNPYLAGAGWAFEIYRQRLDAVRGTIPFLMHQAIQALQRENVRVVSLCLVPGLRASTPLPGDSALARRGLTFGSRYFNFLFDTAGLYHFKSRFRPRFENRYLCARPALTFGSAWAMVRLLGVLDVDFVKLARLAGKRLRKWHNRARLATPQWVSAQDPTKRISICGANRTADTQRH
jgi:phosphatidylglycerol lysyltransferase